MKGLAGGEGEDVETEDLVRQVLLLILLPDTNIRPILGRLM